MDNKEYLKLYEEYVRLNDIFISKFYQFDTPPIIQDKEFIKVNFNQNQFILKKPIYEFITKTRDSLKKQIKDALHEYRFEKMQVLYNNEKDLTKLKKLTAEITSLETELKELNIKHAKQENSYQSRINAKVNTRLAFESEKKLLFDTILNTSDDVQRKSMIKEYFNKVFDHNDSVMIPYNDYYITSLPVVVDNIRLDKPERKLKEKLKKIKKITKTEIEIKDELKMSIKRNIFKTLEECTSTKRSKPYYLSKKEIFDIIEKDPELKKKVGKMYKKLSREDLCDKLFM